MKNKNINVKILSSEKLKQRNKQNRDRPILRQIQKKKGREIPEEIIVKMKK